MTKETPFDIVPFDAAEYLKDEETIAEFLNASVQMNDPAVLLNALTTVIRAQSMSHLAAVSGLGRESLYKALRPGAKPQYATVMKLIHALGVKVEFKAPDRATKAETAPASTSKAHRRKRATERAVASTERRASSRKS